MCRLIRRLGEDSRETLGRGNRARARVSRERRQARERRSHPVPSNSVSILMGITVTVDGTTIFEFHKPYTLNQSDRIAICTENGDPPGVVVVAEVKFTPGP